MLRKFRDVALLALLMAAPFAWQTPAQLPANVRFGTTLPAGCSPSSRTRVLFYKTGATPGLYQCLTLNTWTAVGGGGGVTVGTTTSNGTIDALLKTDNTGKVVSALMTVNAAGTANVPDGQGYAVNAATILTYSSGTGAVTVGAGGAGTKSIGSTTILRPNDAFTSATASLSGFNWRPVVAAKTAAYTILLTEENTVYTNEGTTIQVVFTLPTAVAGQSYTFIVQDVDGIRVNAAAGDTLRIAASVSAAAGNITNAAIGSTVKVTAINATEWIAEFTTGTWVVT